MNDVVIRRCTLRVVRHGGWSWGPQRRKLLEQATAALPTLIAERLAALLGDVEGEIAQPIRLRFALRAGQLASGEGLAHAIVSGIRAECLPSAMKSAKPESPTAIATIDRDAYAVLPRSVRARDGTIDESNLPGPAAMLLRWREQGVLWNRLQGFARRSLELWLAALLAELKMPPRKPEVSEMLFRACTAIHRTLRLSADDPLSGIRARLAIAVELVARHANALSADGVLRALDQVVPGSEPHSAAAGDDDSPHDEARSPMHAEFAGPLSSEATRTKTAAAGLTPARVVEQDIRLCSVLPFIVLGVLHRLGWLDVASATFGSLGLPDRGSVFAMALAYKLLPCPARGWHRTDAVLATAAAFADVRSPPSPHQLGSWSRAVAGALSPLDDFVAGELARGHDLTLPLLVTRVDSGYDRPWLLFDADGGFPVAWERDETSLCRIIRSFGPCVILVSAEAATPALMNGLATDRRSYVTTAIPGRNDDWHRVRGTPCWTGGSQALPGRIVEAARLLPELVAQALSVTRALLQLRPAAPPREGAELEHTAALTAATGLGALSWTLWRQRETVHPLLALARFENLDGIARTRNESLEIRPAFGRRYLDLEKHGLLADIPAPPWISARRIVFTGP